MIPEWMEFGQFLTILLMAAALGMDAFSLGIGIGLRGVRLLDMLRISAVIGLFHMLMPLMGVFMGQYASAVLGEVAVMAGGVMLLLLGIHMVYNSFRHEDAAVNHRSAGSVLLFAFLVSIDSMSVGVTMGLFAADLLVTVLLFGLCGGLMSVTGLLVGRRVGSWAGEYGEALGGVILFVFGIKFLL